MMRSKRAMIDLYTAAIPNGRKVSILLGETGIPYRVHNVDLSRGEQLAPAFLRLNPNNKIPVIIDGDTGATIIESGAILIHLADKAGRFLPAPDAARAISAVLQWLFLQVASVGPMMGQLWYFRNSAPAKLDLPIQRYTTETRRLFGVLDSRLADRLYLADDYSIADMATWPWITAHGALGLALEEWPYLRRWHDIIAERPAVRRGMAVPEVAQAA